MVEKRNKGAEASPKIMADSSFYEGQAIVLYKKIARTEKKLEKMHDVLGKLVANISDRDKLAEYVKITEDYQKAVDDAEVGLVGQSTFVVQWARPSPE